MISGEYYRQNCDLELTISNMASLPEWASSRPIKVYIRSNHSNEVLGTLLSRNSSFVKNLDLYLHGSDPTVSTDIAARIKDLGAKVSSVNWLGSRDLVTPLPIGVATAERLGNISAKKYAVYLEGLSGKRNDSEAPRDIFLYVNFDLTTNLPFRKEAMRFGKEVSNSLIIDSRLTIIENLEKLRRSRYVLSPPGVGPDCFRTWESIYVGAVPIVLKSHWPFSHLNLPVMVVDTYENLETQIFEYELSVVKKDYVWESNFSAG